MRWRVAWVLLLVPFLAGCLAAGGEADLRTLPEAVAAGAGAHGNVSLDGPAPDLDPVRFLAIGDWGTGTPGQVRVAQGMAKVCRAHGCDLVVGLGDNVYPNGTASADDPLFARLFEQVYTDVPAPFYMTLGNHDVWGMTVPAGGDDSGDWQVAYAARTDRAMDRWVMPARWYEHTHGNVRFLAIDTNIDFHDGAADPYGLQQMAWLKERLASGVPNGTWTIVHGHHPLVSNGQHGDASVENPLLGSWLQDALCSGGVDLYLAAHDHDLQWLAPSPGCGATEFVISGAAGSPRDLATLEQATHFACGGSLGFAWFEVDDDVLTARLLDGDGRALFKRVLHRGLPELGNATVGPLAASVCNPAG